MVWALNGDSFQGADWYENAPITEVEAMVLALQEIRAEEKEAVKSR
jgi:hypothetical protein